MLLVAEARPEHEHEWASITSVAAKFGVSSETVGKWVRQAEADAGIRPGTTSAESAAIKRLRRGERRVAPGERDLEGSIAFFAAALDRPGPR